MSTVTEIEGDLFDAPDGAALIHACNSQGSWGAGIAEAFRERYPAAYSVYRSHCLKYSRRKPQYKTVEPTDPEEKPVKFRLPTGTALLIPPQEKNYAAQDKDEDEEGQKRKKHWIICLFTSRKYGKRVSSPATILAYTELAVADLKEQLEELEEWDEGEANIKPPSGLWSCRFNSGLFDVEWSRSRRVLEDVGLEVTVVSPAGEKL